MLLTYQEDGNLVPGIFQMKLDEIMNEFGFNSHRKWLLKGFFRALGDLKSCGCKRIFMDGSFVTRKQFPNDYDACWDEDGVDIPQLYYRFPLFFDFRNGRENQKRHYQGELFPAMATARINPKARYINFFQTGKENNPKGIIEIPIH